MLALNPAEQMGGDPHLGSKEVNTVGGGQVALDRTQRSTGSKGAREEEKEKVGRAKPTAEKRALGGTGSVSDV